MDMQTMKSIDRYAGMPICAALKIFDLVKGGSKVKPAAGEKSPEKIAVIKFWGMGSLILASPMFHALGRTRPDAEIHLITLSQNKGIQDLLGIADKVHYLDLSGGPVGIVVNILGLLKKVSGLGLSAVIDLEYLTRFSAIVSYFSGAPMRVGFHSWDVWRGNLQTEHRAFNPYWHVTDNFINLVRTLGDVDEDSIEPPEITRSGDEEAGALFSEAGVSDDERLIAVNPNASTVALARRWPEESFVELIDLIMDADLGRVALLGAPDEAQYIKRVIARTKSPDQVINLAGKSTLAGLVGILARADLLVTNDSGPLHLADALGTRTVSFFGPETPTLFGPSGKGHVVLYRGIDCSPCISIYNAKTVRCMRQEPECLSKISVGEAFSAVTKALEESG